ncbi:MAG: tetratricopeptide repeat protein, partial [Bdellovibrionales bacterium]|nr:tetratricopeptide repeat protein [Bdellovibrionales bacterium]
MTIHAKSDGKPKVDPLLKNLQFVEGDEKGNEIKALKAELLVSASEGKAIEQAQKLVKKHRGTSLEPDLLFRLAELYMRKAKSDRFFELHRESETIVRLLPRELKLRSSRQSVGLALSTYDRILTKYPSYHQGDVVVFNYAFAHQSLGQVNQAEKLYWKLIQKYSASPLVPDAQLAIGEIAFDKGRFEQALKHFKAIEAYPNSRVYPYGLYKEAWTYYNLRDAKSGLAKLEEVVKFGEYVSKNNIESRLDLRKEALMDMTLFFTEVYNAKEAYAYFTKHAGDLDVGPILMKIATLYERYSRYDDVNTVLHVFIKKLPLSPFVPKAHEKLISSYENLKDRPKVIAQMEEFYRVCDLKSDWSQASPKTSKGEGASLSDEPNCNQILYGTALELAQKWLRIYNKNSFESSYADFSERAFEIYMRSNAKTKAYSEAKYLYAELLFKRKKFREA